jgi:phage tail sheath protein FI
MPQYLSPGVYVEEVDSGSRPIEGVGTAVAAFVGARYAGPVQHPDPDQQLDAVRVHVR